MPSRKIAFRAGEHYHIYNRGNDRGNIFFERENYRYFLSKWREYLTDTAETLAYCLMPTHYHFFVRLASDGLSSAMQSFSQSYTNAINTRLQRVGALFQGRFQAVHVDEDAYFVHLTRYIHLNPIVAGIARRPEDWEFSSYREYVGLRNGTLPQFRRMLREFTSASLAQVEEADDLPYWQKAMARYREFVEGGIRKKDEVIRKWAIEEPG